MKTILFLSNAPLVELFPISVGLHARTPVDWSVQRIGDIQNKATVREIIDFWAPQGCIVQCATKPEIFAPSLFNRIPVVYIDRDPSLLGPVDLAVRHDSAETGRLAARELLAIGLENFAYARATRDWFWSNDRYEDFVAALKLNGVHNVSKSNYIDHDLNKSHNDLKSWLKALPKPVGVFATNDRTAELVILAANELDIQMPTDLAVISVDNCEGICENTSPTITSIAPDFRQAGWLAADLLAQKLADRSIKGVTLRYGQTGIVRRESTRRLPKRNAQINRIIEHLRLHAAEADFSFDRIAEIAGCSLRCAEMHFKKLTGKTLHDELIEQRVERAKLLLRQSDHQIKQVGTLCGFASVATFFRNFTALAGTSPRDYRKRQPLRFAADESRQATL